MRHYKEIAKDFEKRWFFDEYYVGRLTQKLFDELKLKSSHKFLGLGCGTGLYDEAIFHLSKANGIDLSIPLYGVDLSHEMVAEYNQKGEMFYGVQGSIDEFVKNDSLSFDRILIKEVIHHIKDRRTFFKDLVEILSPDGSAHIITRPKNVDFPFFNKALEDFSASQPSIDIFIEELNSSKVHYEINQFAIPIKMEQARLVEMIKARFMSFFNNYSDDIINQGIEEIISTTDELIHFNDNFISFKIYK